MSDQSPGGPYTSYDPYASGEELVYQPPAYQQPAYRESAYQRPSYPPPYQPSWGSGYPAPIIIVNRPTNGKAIASLVLGICFVLTLCTIFSVVPIGFVLGLGTGIPAVILGHKALKEVNRSNGQQGGKEMAIAGLVLGYITLGAAALSGLISLLFFILLSASS